MFDITESFKNKDIPPEYVGNRHHVRDYYLELYGSFNSCLPTPRLEPVNDRFGSKKKILRCDEGPCGFKAYAAEKLIAEAKTDTFTYCAPRTGHAAEAIAYLAQKYGKKCVFFAPSSKRVSEHQAVVLQYGHDLRFFRIAAMPVLNKYAREWAEQNNAMYLPFGLSNCKEVTAGIVHFASRYDEPYEFWCAVSTGAMIRGLQIGWPNARAIGVAVARNIKDGEIGDARVLSYHKPFQAKADQLPSFPTTTTYDAKAWELFDQYGIGNSMFINVGSDDQITAALGDLDLDSINSQRDWGDMGDFNESNTYKVL